MRVEVTKELHIAAPPGMAVYAQNPAYVSATGTALVEGVKHEALHIDPRVGKVYYHPRIFRRRSDDGGHTWNEEPDLAVESPHDLAGTLRCVPVHILDSRHEALICLHARYDIDPNEPMFAASSLRHRTGRLYWEVSRDGARTWSAPLPVIDERPGHDETHWGPGLSIGQAGCLFDIGGRTFLEDGSFVFGMTAALPPSPDSHAEGAWCVRFARAAWTPDGRALRFRIGDPK